MLLKIAPKALMGTLCIVACVSSHAASQAPSAEHKAPARAVLRPALFQERMMRWEPTSTVWDGQQYCPVWQLVQYTMSTSVMVYTEPDEEPVQPPAAYQVPALAVSMRESPPLPISSRNELLNRVKTIPGYDYLRNGILNVKDAHLQKKLLFRLQAICYYETLHPRSVKQIGCIIYDHSSHKRKVKREFCFSTDEYLIDSRCMNWKSDSRNDRRERFYRKSRCACRNRMAYILIVRHELSNYHRYMKNRANQVLLCSNPEQYADFADV